MNEDQRMILNERWAHNPYSYRELFDGTRAVAVEHLLAHLVTHGLTRSGAVGWLATMTQIGRLQMISSDLVDLGPRVEALPSWISAPKEG